MTNTSGHDLLDIFAGLVILYALRTGTLLYKFLNFKPLASVGRVSYGFYLFHDIPHAFYALVISRLVPGTHHVSIKVAILAFFCTLALSFFSFHYFELPFLRLKSYFTADS